jgi:hypothetical protein
LVQLADALGGTARAVMICNVGPGSSTGRETWSTFQFSQQVKGRATHLLSKI